MKSLSVHGTELWCDDRGRGLPLLLVHGFPLDHAMWAGQIDSLSSRCRVIAPDLRGFGRSRRKGDCPPLCGAGTVPFSPAAPEKLTMADFADDLAALLDALEIGEPVVFCGLSMGGYIAFQFLRKYAARLRGLILCDTRAAADTAEAAAARVATAEQVLREGPATLADTMLPRVLGETTRRQRPDLVENVRRVMLAGDPRGIAAASLGMAERPDMTASLSAIECPVLVVVGSEDVATSPAEMRGMAAAISGARFVEIAAAGHLSPLEKPAAVTAAIAEFVAGL